MSGPAGPERGNAAHTDSVVRPEEERRRGEAKPSRTRDIRKVPTTSQYRVEIIHLMPELSRG